MNQSSRLSWLLALNLLLVTVLLVVGWSAHSLGVVAAGVDYLADAAAIGLSLGAVWLHHRPPTAQHPDGYPRAPVVAALVNGGWPGVLSVIVIVEALLRLTHGSSTVHGLPVLIVSSVAALAMIGGAFILGGAEGEDEADDLNLRAVLLDTIADAATAAGVAVTGGIIFFVGGLYWLDPLVALVIGLVVLYHALKLLRDVLPQLRRVPS